MGKESGQKAESYNKLEKRFLNRFFIRIGVGKDSSQKTKIYKNLEKQVAHRFLNQNFDRCYNGRFLMVDVGIFSFTVLLSVLVWSNFFSNGPSF